MKSVEKTFWTFTLNFQVVLGILIPDFEHASSSNQFRWPKHERLGTVQVGNKEEHFDEHAEEQHEYESVVVPETQGMITT